jgi:hypothetical protein
VPTKCRHFPINLGCPACKAEQEYWYQKLEESGFEDAENGSIPSRPLKEWHNFRFKDEPVEQILAIRSYYDMAEELLRRFEFKNVIHRRIWELHCEGKNKRQIEVILAQDSSWTCTQYWEVLATDKPEKEIKALDKHKKRAIRREMIGNIINKIAREIK